MRALVTGGTGFIGSNVVGLLLRRGHDVVIIDDLSSGYRENLLPDAAFREADVRDADAVRAAAAGCAVVFHLAASVGNKRSIDDPRHDAEVNLVGMVSVLEAARANGIEKVVFSSSAGIFGELKSLPIDEESALHVSRLPILYRDPFDRMIVSQAIVHGMTILTPDPLVTRYPGRTIW